MAGVSDRGVWWSVERGVENGRENEPRQRACVKQTESDKVLAILFGVLYASVDVGGMGYPDLRSPPPNRQ